MEYYYLIFLFILAYFLDLYTTKCTINKQVLWNLTKHHLFNTFLTFGFIINNKTLLKIYIIVVIGTLIHWYTNEDKCYLTQELNKLCGYPEDEKFHDLFYFLGLKESKQFDILHYIYFIIILIITYKKIN
jgi:hypothetical protein